MRKEAGEFIGRLLRRPETNVIRETSLDNQAIVGRGRERLNWGEALFTGAFMAPLITAILVVPAVLDRDMVKHAGEIAVLGIGLGVTFSVLGGLEKRRYL